MSLFEPVFAALDGAGTRYIVVGGVAVVLHGHPRLTADLDLVVDLEPISAAAAIEALTGLGLRPRLPVDPRDFADPSVRRRWIEERNLQVFSLWDPSEPMRSVDLFVEPPDDFDSLWQRAISVELGDLVVRVASRGDLIAMKSDTGRAQDRDDIEALGRLGGGDT